MANRPIFWKCTNYQDCLTGYRGEDIEIYPEMVPVCPECGSVLKPVPKETPAYVAHLVNLAILSTIAGALWFAWPALTVLWEDPAPAPAKR